MNALLDTMGAIEHVTSLLFELITHHEQSQLLNTRVLFMIERIAISLRG
jgi:hypothetical protein